MTTAWLALLALAISAMLIVVLCQGDPKRLRAAGQKGATMLPRRRRGLAALACLPGLGCALSGNSAALMLWLGGCALAGWISATWPRRKSRAGAGALATRSAP
jgi:hypothetical protein